MAESPADKKSTTVGGRSLPNSLYNEPARKGAMRRQSKDQVPHHPEGRLIPLEVREVPSPSEIHGREVLHDINGPGESSDVSRTGVPMKDL